MNHVIRATDGTTIEVKDYTRSTAIKAFCWECFGWQGNPKDECVSPQCPLYPFRGLSLSASHVAAASAARAAKNPHGVALKSTKGGLDKESP